MIIDSPGYGYTYAPAKIRRQFEILMSCYLSHAVRLNLVVMLVDASLGLRATDKKMLEKLNFYKKPVQIVLSKVDAVRH